MKHRGNEASGETQLDASLVAILLADRSSGAFIRWACNAYTTHGESYAADQEIYPHQVHLIQERTRKTQEEQRDRTKKSAEVFTPAWLCNAMINARDAVYFGREEVFNRMEAPSGTPTRKTIDFPTTASGRRLAWERYIDARCLEITCGEAPFLVSRYDAADGRPIPLAERIGILDRKLRIIGEHTCTAEDWFHWAKRALESAYAYEYQGDSLFLARLNLFLSISEYHRHLWKRPLNRHQQEEVARILSWNLWQMDGLTATTPFATEEGKPEDSLFDFYAITAERRPLRSLIRDWRGKKTIRFSELNLSTTMKFDFVIGNPPYQLETANKSLSNGQLPSKSIFHHFQLSADQISSGLTVLIYPGGRWIQRSGKGMADFGLQQINDSRLQTLYYYPDSTDLFPAQVAEIADGISIVVKNAHKTTPSFRYFYMRRGEKTGVELEPPGENILPLDPRDGAVVRKIEDFVQRNKLPYLNDNVHSRNLFGIESNFVEKNRDQVRLYQEGDAVDCETEIKLYANDRAGKAGRTTWFVAPRSIIQTNEAYISKWKVVVSSANAGGQKRDWQLEIIDNQSAFGRSRVALSSFETKQEAENFYHYVKSYIIRYAFLMTDEALTTLALKVPDMSDYTSDNKLIDWSQDIDSQLQKLMSLSDTEFEYIKNTVQSVRA